MLSEIYGQLRFQPLRPHQQPTRGRSATTHYRLPDIATFTSSSEICDQQVLFSNDSDWSRNTISKSILLDCHLLERISTRKKIYYFAGTLAVDNPARQYTCALALKILRSPYQLYKDISFTKRCPFVISTGWYEYEIYRL